MFRLIVAANDFLIGPLRSCISSHHQMASSFIRRRRKRFFSVPLTTPIPRRAQRTASTRPVKALYNRREERRRRRRRRKKKEGGCWRHQLGQTYPSPSSRPSDYFLPSLYYIGRRERTGKIFTQTAALLLHDPNPVASSPSSNHVTGSTAMFPPPIYPATLFILCMQYI